MNKLHIYIIFVAVLLFSASCKKSTIDSQYYSPDKSITASVPTLYAGLFNNSYVIPKYWNLYTLLIPVEGKYSQSSGYTNTSKVYEQPVNYTANKWDNYYTTVVSQYREIQKNYEAITDATQKAGYQVFLETASIFYYDQTAQMVDLYGDIPFTNAGGLNATGTIIRASYDAASAIYNFILSDLDRINAFLDTVELSSLYQGQLAQYDYVNGGDLTLWRKYANTLRMRLAMRISYYDESTAKSIVMTMLNDETTYPMVTTVDDAIQINLAGNMISTSNDIRNGFGVNPYGSGYMIDSVMSPTSDPRLPLYFTTNASSVYHGISNTLSEAVVAAGQVAGTFSRYDSATFTENNYFPGIIIDAAESNFLMAEAYARWGTVASATTAYERGIRQSIAFYYSMNANSSYSGTKESAPTETAIAAYLANTSVALTSTLSSNLNKIAIQKWLDFNVMQANQSWAEYRRTKLPALTFPTDNSSLAATNPPNRFLYPSSESTYNADNYAAVASKDNISTKIFWDVQ
ncbi:MAG: SusD/RagB family nutrient-binding outer membrane lipoprotein [Chitinophagaceae bacterium]